MSNEHIWSLQRYFPTDTRNTHSAYVIQLLIVMALYRLQQLALSMRIAAITRLSVAEG